MDFGRGFPIPPRNGVFPMGNSWVPITPEKTYPVRPSLIPVDSQVSQPGKNWGELLGMYTGFLQETPTNADVAGQNFSSMREFDERNQKWHFVGSEENRSFDRNVGSYVENLGNENAAWKNNPLAELLMQKRNVDVIHNRPTGANWYTQSEAASSMLTQPNRAMSSNQRISGCTLQQTPINGFQIPYGTNYNRNSSPKSVDDAASSVTNPFPSTPITPDQAKQLENQRLSEIMNHLIDDCSSQEKDKQANLALSISEEIENRCEELLQNIVDSSSAAISKMVMEKNKASNEGNELGFDLNKTPDQKTPPKRRKHRPKVIKEGKPKTTRNPAGPKNSTPNETPSGKRKYVRKKGLKVSEESEHPGGASDDTVPTVPSKSCRRVLNFDLENGARDESRGQEEEINRGRKKGFNLNLDSQENELNVVEIEQQNGHITENRNIMLSGNILLPEQRAPPTPQAIAKDHALNLIARNLNIRNVNPCEIFLRADSSSANVENNPCRSRGSNEFHQQGIGEIFLRTDTSNFKEKRGFKREYYHTIEQMRPRYLNTTESPVSRVGDNNEDVNNSAAASLEICKKMKMVNGCQEPVSNMPSCTAPVKDFETGGVNGVCANKATSQINGRLLNSYFQRESASTKLVNGVHGVGGDRRIYPMGPTWVEEETSRGHTRVHDLNSLTSTTNWKQLPSTLVKESPTRHYVQGSEICRVNNALANKRNVGPTPSNQGSCGRDKVVRERYKDASDGHRKSPIKSRGTGKQKLPSVDEIIYLLNGLQINGQEQSALVPYKGDNRIVPYEEFDPIKKRKARPKVDLDPETDRIWKLLMGKEGSEGTETKDKDKEKWWEEERRVFRGRADSFIARMHLVQGDRRFSRWKGSVVDSVIGVFLTQNVSDHLSSSAFMSLAAKFPLQSKTPKKMFYGNGTNPIVEEPEIQLPDLNRIERPPMNKPSFTTICESPPLDQRMNNLSSSWTRNPPDQISSLRNYFDSTISQTSEGIRSSSGSNFKGEDRTMGSIPMMNHGPAPINLLQAEKAAMLQQLYIHGQNTRLSRVKNPIGSSPYTRPIDYNILHMQNSSASSHNFQLNMAPHPEVREMPNFGIPGEESISSLSRQAIGTIHMNRRMAHMAESTTTKQNGVLSFQNPTVGPYAFLSQIPTHQGNIKGRQNGNNQHLINDHQQESSKSFQAESTCVHEPIKPTGENFTRNSFGTEERISVFDKQNHLENNPTQPNSREKINSSGKALNGTSTSNISNARKGKAEDEKNKAINWDSLRKQAHSNGKRERSKDTMDSLDYEALRSADVNEISNAIKERGMNNMLAERMKDFLNRMVREHGSIDLEWLRDVPPDKAKDYLLSVRGLGLKSVECVRLLTLHHLAFPVDTNVGRIAVRLGWVPLQPLPESLQLHLLELYPVLESIQKYLWPRLCKLDQRTLYELHYQMITFGKVFCTKSKPNCNACPMRGECRHFASAFASARLALPGPEEKSIVSSSVPITPDKNPPVMTKTLALLPPAENSSNKGLIERNCEPIIEEPATPEPETTEITESDIEDAFYEDPDEIPTIKLDIEEFAVNLHNYMQDNMELQDGDMSKALVALNPEAASIPTPKLKNVSRLRTEHQVYELPDSHPLLEGLDKREPDDPSPYLLAIWTPGETANSFQPPEIMCRAQESGKLCDDKACFSCNSKREANSQIVRGTILIPCRTAMRGSFPLNGTYFQVNEMFADHESSINPIDVPRAWIWNLSRRTVYFGTSVSTIFKGLSTEGIQYCFWRGFVCVRGFDLKTRAPKPLMARLHFPASKLVKTKNEEKQKIALDSGTANGSRY